MRFIVYLPFAASAVLAIAGPRLACRMRPRTGTRLLLVSGTACAVTSVISLALLAATLVGRLPLVAAVGAWSSAFLRHDDPVSPRAAQLAGVALTAVGCAVVWTAVRRARSLRSVRRAGRRLRTTTSGRLVVLDTPDIEAFAIPAGRHEPGRIVVSSGMLRSLNAAEREVVLAHESAHLRHRHHRHRILATLVAAADPLLATLPAAVRHLTERWADEDAAAATARDLTARTVARAALAARHANARPQSHQCAGTDTVLCFGRGDVPRRVRALLGGAPPRRPLATTVLSAIVVGSLISSAEAGKDTAQLFDRAGAIYHARPLPVGNATTQETRHLVTVIKRLA